MTSVAGALLTVLVDREYHDDGMADESARVEPHGAARLRSGPVRLRGVLSSLAAAVLLGWCGVMAYAAADLARRGTVAPAQVVTANDGTGANVVRVRRPAPADQMVGLQVWFGTPAVGSTIDVRYDPHDPGWAEDGPVSGAGSRMAMAFLLGAWIGVAAWWAATRSRSATVL
jgi:hypothetical protein